MSRLQEFYRQEAVPQLMERLSGAERMGSRFAGSFGGGAYVLVGKKRVSTLTPIKPRWATHRRLVSVDTREIVARLGSRDLQPHTP